YEGAFTRADGTPDSARRSGAAKAFGNIPTAGTPDVQPASAVAPGRPRINWPIRRTVSRKIIDTASRWADRLLSGKGTRHPGRRSSVPPAGRRSDRSGEYLCADRFIGILAASP